jgi:hypothetical protein
MALAASSDLGGNSPWFNAARFRTQCDGLMLANDFRSVPLQNARDRCLIAAGQQQLFDPEALVGAKSGDRD